MKIKNNPINHILNVLEKYYPEIDAEIVLENCNIEFAGYTVFDKKTKKPIQIVINKNIPIFAVAKTIAHEVAYILDFEHNGFVGNLTNNKEKVYKEDKEAHRDSWEEMFTHIEFLFNKEMEMI